MFDEFTDAEDLACRAEVLFDVVEGVDCGLGTVGTVQVPGVEAGEVLESAEDLVAAGWGRWLVWSGWGCGYGEGRERRDGLVVATKRR